MTNLGTIYEVSQQSQLVNTIISLHLIMKIEVEDLS